MMLLKAEGTLGSKPARPSFEFVKDVSFYPPGVYVRFLDRVRTKKPWREKLANYVLTRKRPAESL